jgi:cell wall-associated NlpC family hydrolase
MTLLRININVADVRLRPRFKSERLTQVLFNEQVELLERLENYSYVRLYDRYQGYVNNAFLTEDIQPSGNEYIVTATLAAAYAEPNPHSSMLTFLPFSATFRTNPFSNDFLKSFSSRYGEFYVKVSDVISAGDVPQLKTATIMLLIENARRFMGVPYLWGGKTFFGFDCSGFVQVLYKYYGFDLPRDSKDQRKKGTKIDRHDIKAGDLLLFKKHVGLAISPTDFIHSSLTQGGVAINSLDPKSDRYLKIRDLGLRTVRRIVEN